MKIVPVFIFFISSFIFCLPTEKSGEYRYNNEQHLELFDRGNKFLLKGDFQESIKIYKQSFKYARESRDKKAQVKCLIQLGLLHWNTGDLDNSTLFYNRARSVAKAFGFTDEFSKSRSAIEIFELYQQGKESRALNIYNRSINSFRNAIQIAKENKSKYHELKCLRQLSLSYWDLNELHKFYALNEECLDISRTLNHRREIGKAYNNLGVFYWKTNDYSKALSYYQEALKIAKELDDWNEIAICLSNISIIYKYLGFYSKASDYIKRSLEIDRSYGNNEYICMGLNNLGVIYYRKALISDQKKDYFASLKHFKSSLKLVNEYGNIKTEVRILNNIGSVYLDLGKHNDSLTYLEKSLRKALKINDLEATAVVQNNIGFAHLNLGRLNEAEDSFKHAIDIGFNKEVLWEAYYGLGKCLEKKDEAAQAVVNYNKAIEIFDHIRKGISVDLYKAGYARDKLKVYESLVNLLYNLKKQNSPTVAEDIFQVVEKAKARAFLESLGESKIDIRSLLTESLKKREMDISSRISSGIRKLVNENLSHLERQEISEKVKQAENEYLLLISKMRVEVPEAASLVAPVICGLRDVQNQLIDSKMALIEYFLGESQSFVFLILKDNVHLYALPGREKIRDSIKAYLKALSDPPNETFEGMKGSKRLGREFFPFLDKIPDTTENLVIVPDGILYYLPFETLIVSSNMKSSYNNFLISKFKISYSPSSSSLLFLNQIKRNETPAKDLLAFGDPNYPNNGNFCNGDDTLPSDILKDLFYNEGFVLSPLPYSKKEISNISRFISPNKRDVYTGDNASEATFKRISLGRYKIVHFACHGLLDEKIPFRSALALSLPKDGNEDGFLQVNEIYNLRLKSELVILSACQTARGRLENGEGVLGLPRIFFYSGARSVISTLWRIDDKSTAYFMKYFYKFLTEGYSKAQSLRLTKVQMIKSQYSHPFYWAAFILNGEYSTSIFGRSR